ncbi:hypothetical protein CXF82_00445 [Shewanella sp. GutDb-MelDb]|nr:hypothetical protein CXF82_00445 [Shewanella sp. GutDb-MelDb]
MEMNFKSHLAYYVRAGLYKYLLIVLLVFSTSIILSVTFQDWSHISRCGGIITVFGACLLSRDLIRKGPYYVNEPKPPHSTPVKTNRGVMNQINFERISIEIAEKQDNYSKHLGFYILIFGTILWSYGDWVFIHFLPFNT